MSNINKLESSKKNHVSKFFFAFISSVIWSLVSGVIIGGIITSLEHPTEVEGANIPWSIYVTAVIIIQLLSGILLSWKLFQKPLFKLLWFSIYAVTLLICNIELMKVLNKAW